LNIPANIINHNTAAKHTTVSIVFQLVLYPSPLFDIKEILVSLQSSDLNIFVMNDYYVFGSGDVINGILLFFYIKWCCNIYWRYFKCLAY